MNTLVRWGKFNLVGAMGVVVQLAALAALGRSAAGHYLLATAAAIELTLLHNFVWHLHYTWRDRREDTALPAQFLRFQLSNGMVSMVTFSGCTIFSHPIDIKQRLLCTLFYIFVYQ